MTQSQRNLEWHQECRTLERGRSLSLQPQQTSLNLEISTTTESGWSQAKSIHTETTFCFRPTTHSSYNPFLYPVFYQHIQSPAWSLSTKHKPTTIRNHAEPLLPIPTRTNKQPPKQTNFKFTRSSQKTQQTKTKKITSRRYSQRRKQRLLNKTKSQQFIYINQKLYHMTQCYALHYGFTANPRTSLQQNFNNTIKNTVGYEKKQPTNSTFHNLCTINKIPLGTKQLLGLNLNFCLASNKIPNSIPNTIRNMAYNIRTAYYLKNQGTHNTTEYIKQIYVKNRNWNPPPAPIDIKNKITEFERALQEAYSAQISKLNKVNLKNLSIPWQKTLALLKNNTNFTIKSTDKSLGPAILDTSSYVKQVLKNHLLTKDYQQLTTEEVKHRMENLKTLLKNLLHTHKNSLSKPETLYFRRKLQLFHKMPVFYGLPKVHKSPMALCPVISTCGSLLSIFFTWLDFKMKELLPFV